MQLPGENIRPRRTISQIFGQRGYLGLDGYGRCCCADSKKRRGPVVLIRVCGMSWRDAVFGVLNQFCWCGMVWVPSPCCGNVATTVNRVARWPARVWHHSLSALAAMYPQRAACLKTFFPFKPRCSVLATDAVIGNSTGIPPFLSQRDRSFACDTLVGDEVIVS